MPDIQIYETTAMGVFVSMYMSECQLFIALIIFKSCTGNGNLHIHDSFMKRRRGLVGWGVLHPNDITLTLLVCSPDCPQVKVWRYSMALGLGKELYSMGWGQGAAQQGKALLSPCHRLVPPGVESASVCVCLRVLCVSDADGRTAERALYWRCGTYLARVAAGLAALQVNLPCCEVFCIRVRWVMWHQMPLHVPKSC